jgi:hypothetical protein
MVKWGAEATADLDVIADWWSRWPAASIAVACKPSGLTVVDVDGPAGRASWAALTAQHGQAPTVSVTTGRADGGVHYWYRAPQADPPGNSKGLVGTGIDLRGAGEGAGGMVLAPPSWHSSGRRYQWRDRLPLAELPAWLHAPARPQPTMTGSELREVGGRHREARTWAQHGDTGAARRARAWAVAALAGEAADIAAMAPDSGRNDALNGAAYKMGRLVGGSLLADGDVRQALADAAASCGLPAGEAARTITSGLAAGVADPRTAEDVCQRLRQRGMGAA